MTTHPAPSGVITRARRRRRRDLGRIFARLFCVLFAVIALLPIGVAFGLRSAAVKSFATAKTEELARKENVTGKWNVEVSFLPLAVLLTDVRIESSDGGDPALVARRVSVRPKLFGLLSGKITIDQIAVDAPKARVVMKKGALQNLAIKLPERKKDSGPFHAPFRSVSVTDGSFDVAIDDVHARVSGVDLDVASYEDPRAGSSFEAALWVGNATVDRTRRTETEKGPAAPLDEDVVCRLDGRFRIDPDAVTVHRLTFSGSVDLDGAPGTRPGCGLPDTDRRKVEANLSHVRVRFANPEADLPQVAGRIKARAPIALGERFVEMPENDGWVSVDLDLRLVDGMRLPEIDGKLEARDLRITHYTFGRRVEGEVRTRADVVELPRLKVLIGEADVTLGDVRIEPLTKGIPIRTSVDIQHLNFTALLRDLGVHEHSHVQWDVHEGKVPVLSGTIFPLKLDGELTARSENFAVYDAPAESARKARLIGVPSASLTSHVAIRQDAVQFQRTRIVTPKSTIDNGLVSLAYSEILRIELPSVRLDLAELSPIGNVVMAGQADASVTVTGEFTDPRIEADTTIQAFAIGDIPFGNITTAHVRFRDLVVGLQDVKATKGKSHYEMPTGTLDFGGKASLALDGVVTSPSFDFRDFFALWHMEDDPRFAEIEGTFSTRSNVHLALGGPQDKCGAGFVDVDAHARVKDVTLFGERFDDGELDLDYEWTDRLAGIDGARIELHSFNLRKLRKTGQGGSLLGSASINRGRLNGNVVIQGVPLSKVQTLGSIAEKVEATASGFARIKGTVDEWALEGDVDLSPALLRGTRFGPSQVSFRMTEAPTKKSKVVGKTGCGAPIFEAFDKEAYLKDKAAHGEVRATGNLFGGQVHISELVMTRELDPAFRGNLDLEKFDIGAAMRLLSSNGTKTEEGSEAAAPVEGSLTATLTFDQMRKSDYSHAKVDFAPRDLSITQGGQRISLKSTGVRLTAADDKVTLPPMVFELRAKNGFAGNVSVSGSASKLSRGGELDVSARLEPVDLGVLAGTIPRIQRAQGSLAGELRVTGRAVSPQIAGKLTVRKGDFQVQGLPSPVTHVDVDVEADATEIRVTRGSARFSGGTLALTGRVPIRGLGVGAGEVSVAARGIRLSPDDGISLGADADLTLAFSPPDSNGVRTKLPHLSGDVTISAFEYTRSMALTGSLGDLKTRRTVVDTYDPAQDSITLDVNVRARNALRIRNNMVDAQLVIDSDALQVTGTNQRVGLRGELKSLPGGRFHFRTSDFEVRQAILRFEDATRISPNVDVVAVTEYRRMGDSANVVTGVGRQAGLWRITLHAYGEVDNLRLDMTSDPPLSQEDIVLLLTIGMTRTEVDQLQAGQLGAGAALEALAAASGADRVVKKAVPVIDDFRFGSAYSSRTGRTEPQVTLGKRITDNVRASVTTSLSEDRELRSNVEWRLNQQWSVRGGYDNINDAASSTVGNLGVDVRWRVEWR